MTPYSRRLVRKASAGRLHTKGDELRLTASALNVFPTALGSLSTQLIWGQGTDLTGPSAAVNSYGLESELDGDNGDHIYGRYELVDRPDTGSRWDDPAARTCRARADETPEPISPPRSPSGTSCQRPRNPPWRDEP